MAGYAARIESVFVYTYGARVTADTASGATVIPVEFPVDFDEEGGNLTHTASDPGDPTTVDTTVYAYTGIDIDGETITLASATGVDFAEDDLLSVSPPINETRALVRLSDGEDDPAIECRVAHGLRPLLSEGVRAPGEGESVLVEQVANEWVISDLVGETPMLGATLTNSATDPKTSINPDGTFSITDVDGNVIYELASDGTVTWFDASGNILMQQTPSGILTIAEPALIQFPAGQSWESTPYADIQAQVGGTAPAQYIQMALTGPATNVTGARDRVLALFNSAAEDNSSSANLEFVYQGSNGVLHLQAYLDISGFNILAGSICAADPTTLPAVPESWKTLSLVNSYSHGTNNGFIDVPQVRLMADNKNLQFKGTLATPSSPSSNVFASVPSGYPNANLGGLYGMALVANLSGGTVDHLEVHNNGNIALTNSGSSLNFDISCIVATQ